MKPLINDGSMVEIKPLTGDIMQGMVTAVQINDRILIHRIVELSKTGQVKTKGDNLLISDGFIPREAIIGEVVIDENWVLMRINSKLNFLRLINPILCKIRLFFSRLFECFFYFNENMRILTCLKVTKLLNQKGNSENLFDLQLPKIANSVFSITERIIRMNFRLSRKLKVMY